jgi:SAM-dependent methyltransferase
LPPPALQVLVVGHANGRAFLDVGRAQAAFVVETAAAHGVTLDRPRAVFEFGCGCGRLARWVAPQVEGAGGTFSGSDLNPRLVRWCQANLPGRYHRNRLRPPLRLASGSQDLAYAFSVVTHLTRPVAEAWAAELARVLKPGGLALVSFHDEDWPRAPADLAETGYAVTTERLEGSNHMAAFATRAAFAGLCAAKFEVLAIRPSEPERPMQAWAVLRRQA